MNNFAKSTVYQIYPKSFMDSNNDGIGDIKGIIEKLPYIKTIGADYIWSTPFFASPLKDNGYDISNYYEINPLFGTIEDVKELIKKADDLEIGLMFDMVFNHTSTEHEWFQRALGGDENFQKYYYFVEGDGLTPPTNWQSKFGGSAWEYVPKLKKWYLHLFDKSQADLNWENQKVREELKNVIRFWKNLGVRGFRFDVINLVSKPDIFENDYLGDGRRFYTDGPRIHEYLKELVKDTGIEDMITVGEMSSTTIDNCIKYSNPKEKELSMCFNFHHLKIDYKNGNKWELKEADLVELKNLFKTWQEEMDKNNGWNAVFWCNHDQPRIVSRLGDDKDFHKESSKMLGTFIHLLRGTPYIYQGEEIGMTNAYFDDISTYEDVESINYYEILINNGKTKEEALEILRQRSRDNSRTPMQWDDTKNAGFSKAKPWLALPENYKEINVKVQLKDNDSILNYYRRLIELRKNNKIISEGEINFINNKNHKVIAYKRTLEEKELYVICNFSNENQDIDFDLKYSKDNVLISNYKNNVNGKLRPFEAVAVLL